MAAEVAERPAAKVPPTAPVEVHPFRAVVPPGHGPDPLVVVEPRRHGGRGGQRLGFPGGTRPMMHLVDVPDDARARQLGHAPVVVRGVDLVPGLGGQLGLAGHLHQAADLADGVGQRLLAIDGAPALEGRDGDDGVGVVRRGDHDAVEVLAVEQAAEVGAGERTGKLGGGGVQPPGINVAERHDVLVAHAGEVLAAAARDADDAEVELLIGRQLAGGGMGQPAPSHGGGGGGTMDELTTRDVHSAGRVMGKMLARTRPGSKGGGGKCDARLGRMRQGFRSTRRL